MFTYQVFGEEQKIVEVNTHSLCPPGLSFFLDEEGFQRSPRGGVR